MQVIRYAQRDGMVDVVQWQGGERNFEKISGWTGGRARLSGTDLILQSPDKTGIVELSDYIVATSPISFYAYTFAELQDLYVPVQEQEAL